MRFHLKSILALFALIFAISPMAGAADINFTIYQDGTNVVATADGFVNTSGLGIGGSASWGSMVNTDFFGGSVLGVGPDASVYQATGLTGSGAFGTVDNSFMADSNTGSTFIGIVSKGAGSYFYLPVGYVSGSSISSTATFNNITLSDLGLTLGTYNWTWSGGTGQLKISAVPEPSTYALAAIATGVMGAVARRRKAHRV